MKIAVFISGLYVGLYFLLLEISRLAVPGITLHLTSPFPPPFTPPPLWGSCYILACPFLPSSLLHPLLPPSLHTVKARKPPCGLSLPVPSIAHARFIPTVLGIGASPTTEGRQMKATALMLTAAYLEVSSFEYNGAYFSVNTL